MVPDFAPQPLVLEGAHVRLEPLRPAHAADLFAAAHDPGMWEYLLIPPFRDVAAVAAWIAEARRAQAADTEVPFATVRRADGRVVGTTRFLEIRRAHRGLEIGWTWLAPEARRTAVNTEAKLLMLEQAFTGWGARRVQLKTDARNAVSRRAILRLGATFEGVLRQHLLRPHDGYVRDSAMFSLIDHEWPAVRARLAAQLLR